MRRHSLARLILPLVLWIGSYSLAAETDIRPSESSKSPSPVTDSPPVSSGNTIRTHRGTPGLTGHFRDAFTIEPRHGAFPSAVVLVIAGDKHPNVSTTFYRRRGVLYTRSVQRPGGSTVFALDPAGEVLWTHSLQGLAWSAPMIADGRALIGSTNGAVTALSVFTGDTLWQAATHSRIGATPTVHGHRILCGNYSGSLRALDSISGKLLWECTFPEPLSGSVTVMGDRGYVGCQDGRLYAVDLASGDKEWNYRTHRRVITTPLPCGDAVVFPSWDGYVYSVDLLGSVRWKLRTGIGFASPGVAPFGGKGAHAGVLGTPALDDNVLYAASTDGLLYAWRADSGTAVWEHRADFSCRKSPAIGDGVVFVSSEDPAQVLAFSTEDGSPRWSYTLPAAPSGPSVFEEIVFIGSGDTLYALQAATGRRIWKKTLGGVVGTSSIAEATDGAGEDSPGGNENPQAGRACSKGKSSSPIERPPSRDGDSR